MPEILVEHPEPVRIGRYVVLGSLGEGAMGVVYRAYDESLDRKVALKLLHPQRGDPRAARLRLQREAQALAQLSHPNVVQVYDVGEWNGLDFIALELVRGETLRTWMAARAREWAEIIEVFVQAGRGLAAAHAAGLVHRDFKPDNVLIAEDGRARVADFGLALAVGSEEPLPSTDLTQSSIASLRVTEVGTLIGTPGYMSPEQFMRAGTDARSDQFAFCVALFEALYGYRPFAGDTVEQLSRRVLLGERLAPPVRTRVPSWVEATLARGLAIEPDHRFPSMDALLAELTRDRSQGRRRLRWLARAAAAAAVVAAAVGYQQWDEAQRTEACAAQGDAIAAEWNETAKQALREGLRRTGVGYVEATLDKVIPYFDAQAQAWRAARTQACTDARVRGTWSEELLDRASGCLDERRMELAALVAELSRADAKTVQRAVVAAAGLRPVAPCLDALQLQRRPAPPDDRAAVRAVQASLSQVGALRAAGRYAEALALAQSTLREAEALRWPPLVAAATLAVGDALERMGDYAAAERTLEDGYFAAVDANAAETAAAAAILLVGTVGRNLARPSEGIRWARHAEGLLDELGEPDDGLRRARSLTQQGLVFAHRGAYDEAQARFERALAIREKTLGPGHPEVAFAFMNLGNVSFHRGAYDEARARFARALEIQVEALGPGHPDVAATHNNLGAAFERLGAYDEARALHERALAIQEAALGPEHPELASSLNNLGNAYLDTGAVEEARLRFARALEILEKALGPEHPDLAAMLNNLGIAAMELRDYPDARARHERALAIREKALGPEHRDVAVSLDNLGIVDMRLGALDAAGTRFARALAIQEKALGPDHPDVALSLANLGSLDLKLGALERARARFERALAIVEASFGREHPSLLDALRGLGEVALRERRPDAALGPLERALVIHGLASDPPALTAETRFLLAQALWDAPEAAGRDRPRARGLAEAVRDAYREAGAQAELAEVERWLASRRD